MYNLYQMANIYVHILNGQEERTITATNLPSQGFPGCLMFSEHVLVEETGCAYRMNYNTAGH